MERIKECMKANKQLSADEMKALRDEVMRTLETVGLLEKEAKKNLMALGSKTKEYDNFRDHTSKKITGMAADHENKVEDLLVELRETEIKLEEAEERVKDFERIAIRDTRRQSTIDFGDIQAATTGAPTPKQYHQKIRQLEDQLRQRDKLTADMQSDLKHFEEEEGKRIKMER